MRSTVPLFLIALAVVTGAAADVVEIEVGSNSTNRYRVLSPVPGQGTNVAQIQPGDTVRWTWSSGLHSVTADDGSFDSGLFPTPFSYERTFPDPGQIGYFCTLHGIPGRFMFGTLLVGAPCPADVNLDRDVNVFDLLLVLTAYNGTGGPEDVNGDGVVNVLDLLAVLAAWGPCED